MVSLENGSMFTNLREKIEALPRDLTAWIPARHLMRLVFEAIESTDWPEAAHVERRTPQPILATVMTFCYARGVFSSAEIAALASEDPDVRYLCARQLPTFEEIRHFRRQNVALIRETLARVLSAVWQVSNQNPISFLSFIAEADHRLASAIEADSAAMDSW